MNILFSIILLKYTNPIKKEKFIRKEGIWLLYKSNIVDDIKEELIEIIIYCNKYIKAIYFFVILSINS